MFKNTKRKRLVSSLKSNVKLCGKDFPQMGVDKSLMKEIIRYFGQGLERGPLDARVSEFSV